MVKYETILKVIEDEITKSHQHLKINPQVHNSLNQFRKRTRKRKTELGYLLNDKGEKMREVKGDKDSVMFGGYMAYCYEKNNLQPLHVEHNHPNPVWSPYPTCLSATDMRGLFLDVSSIDDKLMCKSVTAEDSWNNSRMTLVLGDSWHKKPLSEWDDKMISKKSKAMDLSQKLEDLHIKCEEEYYKHEDDYFNEVWDKGDYHLKTSEDFDFYNNLRKKSKIRAMKNTGYSEELKKIKKEFRELDCRLTLDDMDDNLSKKTTPDSYVNLMSAL